MTSGPFPLQDDIVEPVLTQLASVISSQIPGLSAVYINPPDRPLDHKSVLIAFNSFKQEADTNGKIYLTLAFTLYIVFRRTQLSQDVPLARSYLAPFLHCLTANGNQTLTDSFGVDHANGVTPSTGGIKQWKDAGQNLLALIVNCDVLTEFNVAL